MVHILPDVPACFFYNLKKAYWEGIQNGVMQSQIHRRSVTVRCQRASFSSEWIQISVRLFERFSNYSKVRGYKVNIPKSITFLYTSKKQVEFDIKNTIPLTLALQHEIFRYKSNKIHRRSMWGNLQNSDWRKSKN